MANTGKGQARTAAIPAKIAQIAAVRPSQGDISAL